MQLSQLFIRVRRLRFMIAFVSIEVVTYSLHTFFLVLFCFSMKRSQVQKIIWSKSQPWFLNCKNGFNIMISAMFTFYFCPKLQDKHCKNCDYDYGYDRENKIHAPSLKLMRRTSPTSSHNQYICSVHIKVLLKSLWIR